MATWARSISGFSAVLFAVSAAGHRYGQVDTLAFLWLLAIVAALALLGLALAAGGFWRLWEYGDRAGRASLAATLLSLVVLAPFVAGLYFALRYPPLTDISTDLVEPPHLALAQRARTGAMNPVVPIPEEAAGLQLRHYPDLAGRRYEASMERVMSAVEVVVASRGWTPRGTLRLQPDAAEYSFEAEAPTFLMRFVSDAAVRLTDEGESVFVDLRLATRYGRHDFGDGARRIRAFMAALDAEFARQTLEIIDIPSSDGPASDREEDPVD